MDLPTTRHDAPVSTASEPRGSDHGKNPGSQGIFEKVSLYLFLATLFLAPLAFLPSMPLDVVKTVVVSVGLLAAIIFCAIGMVKTRSLNIPKGAMAKASFAVIISLIISVFASTQPLKSFFGQGFEIGTASFLILLFVAAFYVAKMAEKNKERVFNIYAAIFASFIILALFHIMRIIGGEGFMTFGFLNSLATTLVGKWYDFGIFAGLIGVLSLLGLKFLSPGRGMKILLVILLIVSGLFLFVVNFNLAWWAIALTTLALGVYEYSSRPAQGTGLKKIFSRISILTLIVLVVSVSLAWKGKTIASPTAESLKLNYGELILPWQMTVDITADTVKESPLFGAGPNRFGVEFLKYKPFQAINPTAYWTAEFTNGFGTIPSFVATQGLLGLITWLIFFIVFIRLGIRALAKAQDHFKKFAITSSFFGATFLWIIHFIYVPSHVILFFAFIMTGLFCAELSREGLMSFKDIGAKESNSKLRKYVPILSIIILIVSIAWLGSYIKKAVAVAYFQSGIRQLNSAQSPEIAQSKFTKALFWNTSDVYYQALSETDIVRISILAQQIQAASAQSGTQPDPKAVEQVTNLVTEALDYTKKAIAVDPTNYYNYAAQAHVLEVASSLKIPNAYENAKAAYAAAITLNPTSPALFLKLARLEASQNHLADAQQYIGRALQLKQNYTEAIFLLSQIQVANGQIKDAITSVQVATQITPSDPLLHFQLGLLYYNDKNYSEATLTKNYLFYRML
jgi:tetratricopeptide (TPR) repeat protein/O-antigen ligase